MSALESMMMLSTGAGEAHFAPDVQAAARGDRAAYARLVDGTRNMVCSISLSIVRDVPASEDVAQEVYLAVWRGLSRLRNPSSFLPWLRQLTRNRAHDQLRRSPRPAVRAPLDGVGHTELADPRPDARAQLIAGEEEAALVAALESLPDAAREVVTLFYREGQSVAQVASLLGLSEPAVKKRLSRARVELRAATLERLGESLERSAPAAIFTTLVLGAITAGAPATASAAILAKAGNGSAALAKLGGTTLAAKLAAAALGVGGGALAGALGVVIGMRPFLARARSDEERRKLKRFTIYCILITLSGAAAMPLGHALLPGGVGLALGFGCFWLAIAVCYLVWLPRIVAAREAEERAEDPHAAARQRRQWRRQHLFLALGTVSGGGTVGYVIWALYHH